MDDYPEPVGAAWRSLYPRYPIVCGGHIRRQWVHRPVQCDDGAGGRKENLQFGGSPLQGPQDSPREDDSHHQGTAPAEQAPKEGMASQHTAARERCCDQARDSATAGVLTKVANRAGAMAGAVRILVGADGQDRRSSYRTAHPRKRV